MAPNFGGLEDSAEYGIPLRTIDAQQHRRELQRQADYQKRALLPQALSMTRKHGSHDEAQSFSISLIHQARAITKQHCRTEQAQQISREIGRDLLKLEVLGEHADSVATLRRIEKHIKVVSAIARSIAPIRSPSSNARPLRIARASGCRGIPRRRLKRPGTALK